MKFLILAHRWDTHAAAVAAALQRRHPNRASRIVTMEELIFAPSWVHRVEAGGTVTQVTLHDGCTLHSGEIGVVFNRLRHVDMPHFPPAERNYATAEMSALLLSWLEGMPCPIVNPAVPLGLGGAMRRPVQWFALAAEAGLPVPRVRLTSNLRRFP